MELLKAFLLAMLPIGELRVSIPVAMVTDGVAWYQALPVSILGNLVPVIVLVPTMERLSRFLAAFSNPLGRLLAWRGQRLRLAHQARFQRYGPLALAAFVAIPLPLTGAWTGILLAWAFQVPVRTAMLSIALGVAIAGGIVTGLTMGGIEIGILLGGG